MVKELEKNRGSQKVTIFVLVTRNGKSKLVMAHVCMQVFLVSFNSYSYHLNNQSIWFLNIALIFGQFSALIFRIKSARLLGNNQKLHTAYYRVFFLLSVFIFCPGYDISLRRSLFFETDVLIIALLISNLWSSMLRWKICKNKFEIDQDLLTNSSLLTTL